MADRDRRRPRRSGRRERAARHTVEELERARVVRPAPRPAPARSTAVDRPLPLRRQDAPPAQVIRKPKLERPALPALDRFRNPKSAD